MSNGSSLPTAPLSPSLEELEPRRLLSSSGPTSILVSAPNFNGGAQTINEYSLSGNLMNTFTVPIAGDGPVRDMAVDSAGNIQVYVGTNSPALATYNRVTGKWASHTAAGWASFNVTGDGGIATYANYVFVTSQSSTAGDSGIVRFDTANGYAAKLFPSSAYRHLALGQDGKLYALTEPGTVADRVDVYDPLTMKLLNSITLPGSGDAAVAADSFGNLFLLDSAGAYRIDSNGNLLVQTAQDGGDDIDLSSTGQIVTDFGGRVILSDSAFNPLLNFKPAVGDTGTFYVAWGDYEGPTAPSTVGGTVFNDKDANGIKGRHELGLAGVRVYVDLNHNGVPNKGEPSTLTDANGRYTFTGLAAGKYRLQQVPPAGFRQSAPATTGFLSVSVSAGSATLANNFGDTQRALLRGTVYADVNADGRPDKGDFGLAGWTVYVDSNNNGRLDAGEESVLTDVSGNYVFGTLTAGTDTVRVVEPQKWVPTVPTTASFSVTLIGGQIATGTALGLRHRK